MIFDSYSSGEPLQKWAKTGTGRVKLGYKYSVFSSFLFREKIITVFKIQEEIINLGDYYTRRSCAVLNFEQRWKSGRNQVNGRKQFEFDPFRYYLEGCVMCLNQLRLNESFHGIYGIYHEIYHISAQQGRLCFGTPSILFL